MHPLRCCCGTSRRWLLFSHVSVWLTWGRREWEALKIGSVIKDLDVILQDYGVDPKLMGRHFATGWFSWLGAVARWCGGVGNLRWIFLPQKHFRMRKAEGWSLWGAPGMEVLVGTSLSAGWTRSCTASVRETPPACAIPTAGTRRASWCPQGRCSPACTGMPTAPRSREGG